MTEFKSLRVAHEYTQTNSALGAGPPFHSSQLPRVPRPCRVLCDRAGILTSYLHHSGHSCPGFFITNKLCEPSQTSSIAQCDNDPLMGKGRGVLVN